MDHLLRGAPFHAQQLRAENELNAFTHQLLLNDTRGIRVFAVKQMRLVVKQSHLRAQPLKSLRQFATDWTAANHREPWWQTRQVENRFIGEKTGLAQTGNVRLHGARARRNNSPFETQPRPAHFHRV